MEFEFSSFLGEEIHPQPYQQPEVGQKTDVKQEKPIQLVVQDQIQQMAVKSQNTLKVPQLNLPCPVVIPPSASKITTPRNVTPALPQNIPDLSNILMKTPPAPQSFQIKERQHRTREKHQDAQQSTNFQPALNINPSISQPMPILKLPDPPVFLSVPLLSQNIIAPSSAHQKGSQSFKEIDKPKMNQKTPRQQKLDQAASLAAKAQQKEIIKLQSSYETLKTQVQATMKLDLGPVISMISGLSLPQMSQMSSISQKKQYSDDKSTSSLKESFQMELSSDNQEEESSTIPLATRKY